MTGEKTQRPVRPLKRSSTPLWKRNGRAFIPHALTKYPPEVERAYHVGIGFPA